MLQTGRLEAVKTTRLANSLSDVEIVKVKVTFIIQADTQHIALSTKHFFERETTTLSLYWVVSTCPLLHGQSYAVEFTLLLLKMSYGSPI